jgi:hypothetical protein
VGERSEQAAQRVYSSLARWPSPGLVCFCGSPILDSEGNPG